MGCGACIGDKSVVVPLGYASALEAAHFVNIKRDLKPCGLVPQTQFSQIIKQLQQSTIVGRRNNKIIGALPEQEDEQVVSGQDRIRLKWKLLVFCLGDDFYDPDEYEIVDSGLQHQCFSQIQKDLHRTFPEQKFFKSENGVVIFDRLLKRLALYFPAVGYTQGLNFIVGFLLVQGFTEEEAFWMMVHMSMSPRFLLLGFYEDGFPMSSIYCRFLNNMFKQSLPNLFLKFQEMGVAGQAWMFKWFMTYYLYSFPREIAKEVWSLVMLRGGIGMVYFGLSLLEQLQKQLQQLDQATEVIGFLQNLRDSSTFHSLVNIKSLLKRAYSVEMTNDQLQHQARTYMEQTKVQNFYTRFFGNSTNLDSQRQLLETWHQKLKKQRLAFRKVSRIVLSEDGIAISKKVPQGDKSRRNKPPRESRFRIKEEEFRKTKQKNFAQKNSSLKEQQVVKQDLRKSKGSSKNSKASRIIQVSSISNQLKISNYSSSVRDSLSRMPSEESFIVDDHSSLNREMTEQEISDGESTARYNASVHVITRQVPSYPKAPSHQEVEIFDLNRPFKKKKEGLGPRNQSTKISLKKHTILLPESLCSLNKKTSQKTVIEIGPNNIVCVQQTIYSIDPSDQSVIDFQASTSIVHGQSLGASSKHSGVRYRTPQILKSHCESVQD